MRPSRSSTRKKDQPRARSHRTRKERARVRRATRPGEGTNRWSQRVTRESNALDLEPGVFTMTNPRAIAESLKRSADRSDRRKARPYQSAMSMLTFYINRAGRSLSTRQRSRLERAKDELRALYDMPRRSRRGGRGRKRNGSRSRRAS